MIIIHALLHVNPAREEEFLEAAKPMITATHEEEGNLSYELYKHAADGSLYIMVETWRDQAAVAAHNTSPHFTAFAARAGEFLSAPLDVKAYHAEELSK
ncbi:antibiotic biosynthesis monooxygenase [Paenibacillus tritici]|uniref:Antibiotic biosynthesis monooxygenase n=1 Tax=Paenibacillus tritici TaxID=1873425 RepID=A0ABX2DVP5_9BACL|nr:putative quinol monooxygenase [Paenibacillus tritici]NQX48776.1 antibiotic biosynthesis monooxygenase [Paenibacillus tritici]QUL55527.1 antibiotic biosynthesis monooxygenase [Paenibacillus tritici]